MPPMTISDLPYSNNLLVADLVRQGIPARALKSFAETLKLNLTDIAQVVHIPRRTLERRIADNARLRTPESERVVRLGRIYAKARDVFEDGEEAARWLIEPLESFAGKTPLELSSTEPGAREVEQILGRIEHGVFS
jgi:putative toxin-antitoxin system antitoxin component (TIGR02293 family)